MEGDRGLSLLRQAFVEGYLRTIDVRPQDPKWWQKVRLTLDWLNVKNLNEIRRMRHELNCALLDYKAGDRAVDLHWEQSIKIQNLVQKDIMPWRDELEVHTSRKAIYDMVDKWKSIFGDPEDPEVAERIRKTAEHLQEMSAGKNIGRGL